MKKGLILASAALLLIAGAAIVGNSVFACDGAKKAAGVAAAKGASDCHANKTGVMNAAAEGTPSCCAGKAAAMKASAEAPSATREVYPISNGVVLVYNAHGCEKALAGVRAAAAHGCKTACGMNPVTKASATTGEKACGGCGGGCSGKSKPTATRASLEKAAAGGCEKSKAALAYLAKYDNEAEAIAALREHKKMGCGQSAETLAVLERYGIATASASADSGNCPLKAQLAKEKAGCGNGCLMSLVKDMKGVEMEKIETPTGAIVIVTGKRGSTVDELHAWAQTQTGQPEAARASL